MNDGRPGGIGAARDSDTLLAEVVLRAASIPGVRISREAFLRRTLSRHCSESEMQLALDRGPSAAGISPNVVNRAASDSIRWESTKVTSLSAAAGIPGGLFMIGTIPADLAQYFGHMLRVAQKLAYLYGWPDLFATDEDEMDDGTKNILILFVGAMFGTNLANDGLRTLSTIIANRVSRDLPKRALTKGVVYPIVKRVAGRVGVQMTKQIFANGIAKIVPVVGAIVSGGVTVATFVPMSLKLKKHLSTLELAGHGVITPR